MFPQRGRAIAFGVVLCMLAGVSAPFAELLEPSHEVGDCGCPPGCPCRTGGKCSCGGKALRVRALCSCGNTTHDSEAPHSAPEVVFAPLPIINQCAPTLAVRGDPTAVPSRLLIREKDHPF